MEDRCGAIWMTCTGSRAPYCKGVRDGFGRGWGSVRMDSGEKL